MENVLGILVAWVKILIPALLFSLAVGTVVGFLVKVIKRRKGRYAPECPLPYKEECGKCWLFRRRADRWQKK